MKAILLAMLLCVTLAAPVAAEPTPLKWPLAKRPIADHVSNLLVAWQLGADTIASWRAPDRRRAFVSQTCRTLVVLGAAEAVKRLVHRPRPDGSDRHSFPSGHTALASVASGWRLEVGIPIAMHTAWMRMAADKHYLSDTLAGAGLAALASAICPARSRKVGA